MPPPSDDPLQELHRHLSDAMGSLADAVVIATAVPNDEFIEVTRLLTAAQQKLTRLSRRNFDSDAITQTLSAAD